jgi:translation elongation factor EF-1beta
MTRRISIVTALAEKLKVIDGTGSYKTDLFGNSYPKLKFWDEVQDFPCTYLSAGTEVREYMPSDFTWGYLNISVKVYVRSESESQQQLENLLDDIENVIDANRVLVYDTSNNFSTTEILIQSITTDEGLLAPYGVGEINLQVRYALV